MLRPVRALFLILLFFCFPSHAPADPAAAALDFLNKLRDGRANLEPGGDTALSPQTQAAKRAEIARRLERISQDLKNGELETLDARAEGDMAAVIICKTAGYDPALLRVVPLAVLNRGGRWLPAPVPGSFDNCGLGFSPTARARAKELESWLLERQALLLDQARLDLAGRMQGEIAASVNRGQLREMTPADVARRFVAACAAPQAAVALALQGGLQPELPENWSARLKATTGATAEPDSVPAPWRLLVAPEVLRTVVHEEALETEGTFSVACIDPLRSIGSDNPPVELLHLGLEQSRAGLWQVNLPDAFLKDRGAGGNRRPGAREDAEDDDQEDNQDLLDKLPASLRREIPASAHPELPAALAALHQALLAPTPRPLIALLDLEGPAATARRGCSAAAGLWGLLHDSSHIRTPLLLDHTEDGDTAAVSYQFYSMRQNRLDLRLIFLEKDATGWRITRGVLPEDDAMPRFAGVTKWAQGQAARWKDGWRNKLLDASLVTAPAAANGAPTAEQTRELLDNWFSLLSAADPAALIALTARLDGKDSATRLLRNLGYEINSARRTKSRPATLALASGEVWTAAAVRSTADNKPAVVVYPIIHTPDGPRILLETDLFISADKAREFLNNQSFAALDGPLPPSAVEELRGLLKKLAADPAVGAP